MFHKSDGIAKNTDKGSTHYGDWYYKKNTSRSDGAGGVIVNPYEHYGGSDYRKVGSGGLTDGIPPIEQVVDKGAAKIEGVVGLAGDGWNSQVARTVVPDYKLSFTGQTSSGVTLSEDVTFTLLLRGKDPGLFINTTTTGEEPWL